MRETKLTNHARSILAVTALSLTLAACGGGGDTAGSTTVAATDQTTATSVVSEQTSTSVSESVDKANANSASVDEIAAALAAAGVDNADRWAREVVEYRPYDTSDADLTHLRDELVKYNPAEGVVDLIVSALEL